MVRAPARFTMQRFLLLLALLAAPSASPACSARFLPHLHLAHLPSTPTSQPLIFVFGASMVDAGQNSAAMPRRSRADFQPYGVDYFGKPSGRWSNGRTLMDFITEGLGYGHLSPYMRVAGSDFTHGVNFASSGSTAVNSSAVGANSGGLFCLLVQIDQFTDYRDAMLTGSEQISKGGRLNRQQFSDAIYFFETGVNDYIRAGMGNSSDEPIEVTVSTTIAAMKKAFLTLYEIGARTFLITNLPPLGCYPVGLIKVESGEDLDENSCNAQWMSVVRAHNDHLEELMAELREGYPAAEWVTFDIYSLVLEAYTSPSKYGLKYPYQACCGAGGEFNFNSQVGCGATAQYINGTLVQWTKCEDPTLYVSWDGQHPVESFAYFIAQGVLNATHVIPSSFNIMSRVQPS